MPDAFVAHPAEHVSPTTTAVVVDGVGVLGLGVLVAIAVIRRAVHRGRERLALKAALRQGEPLHPGSSVLAGTVVDEGDGNAIVITLEQAGREWRTKHGWAHKWTEQHRTIEVKPFYVQRANGERVRVEPDARVFLVDRLDATERLSHERRIRRAQLSPGEHVFILGDMTRAPDPKLGGYREGAEGWVLRPPRNARMLISTEPLEDRHRRRARIWRNLALVTVGLFLFWHGILFSDVHRFRWSGRTVVADTIDKRWWRNWVRPSKGSPHWVYHYEVTAAGENGEQWSQRIDHASYGPIEKGMPLAFLVADGKTRHVQIGNRACAGDGSTFAGFALASIWLVLYLTFIFSTQPWWERRRVVESGSGRL
jgi:hypothetical protein